MKFSFVIPAYNHWDLVHQLLWDIYKNCSRVHEIIIVDDVSSDESFLNGLSWWQSNGMLPIEHVRPVKNQGFLKSSNKGLKKATGDVIALISTDVRIFFDIVQLSSALVKEFPKSLIGGRLIHWDSGWNTFNGKTYPYIEGWLLITSQENWKELDYFDEQYAPFDAEDMDLSTKARSLGYMLLPLADEATRHIGAQSIPYGSEREQQTRRNIKKFEDKWIHARHSISSSP